MADDFEPVPRVGTQLRGKWTLERLLGAGGMACVYVGRHRIGRRDAIKILHPQIARNRDLRARFEREARVANAFQHPGAVAIRDIDVSEDGCPFLVLELLEGEPLSSRTTDERAAPIRDVLGWTYALLDVLAAAHAQGIVHRDIKPDNLFVLTDGRLKVLDFGIARVRDEAANTLHTKTGAVLGTTSFMPPEQFRGGEVDARADVFAVGATMFRLIARRRIHEGRTDAELLVKMATEPAPKLTTVAPGISAEVCRVVDRALAFNRDDRYASAREMQADVRALLGDGPLPIAAEPPSAEGPMSRAAVSGPARRSGSIPPTNVSEIDGAFASAARSGELPAGEQRQRAKTTVNRRPPWVTTRLVVISALLALLGVGIGVLIVRTMAKGSSSEGTVPTAPASAAPTESATAPVPTVRRNCGTEPCEHECSGSCSIACTSGTCRVDMSPGSDAACTGSGQCAFWCRGDCSVRCGKSDGCLVYCPVGGHCRIDSCATDPHPCKGGAMSCGVRCPR